MTKPEAWLGGPIEGIEPLLQPVAHALTQAREDLESVLGGLSEADLWKQSGASAPIGYHLTHLTGSLDRLLTYARGAVLNTAQLSALATERKSAATLHELRERFEATVERALAQLRETSADTLLTARRVGRAGLPSTTIGLLFHAAEHTARHVGQIMTLVRVLEPDGGGA
jgi:uncharacterized damage-inducible protein DinB